jgi:hypothetical protein
MSFLKSVKRFVMTIGEAIVEARKARADAIKRGIGR